MSKSSDYVKIIEISPILEFTNTLSAIAYQQLLQLLTSTKLDVITITLNHNLSKLPKNANYRIAVTTQVEIDKAYNMGIKEVMVKTATSNNFAKYYNGQELEVNLWHLQQLILYAAQYNIKVSGYIAGVIACPFEGKIPSYQILNLAERLLKAGCEEIILGEILGVATPYDIKLLLKQLLPSLPITKLAVHCHNTYGQALANLWVALDAGIRTVMSSIAGLGNCQYAPQSVSNIATEEVLYMLESMHFKLNTNLDNILPLTKAIYQKFNLTSNSFVATALNSQ